MAKKRVFTQKIPNPNFKEAKDALEKAKKFLDIIKNQSGIGVPLGLANAQIQTRLNFHESIITSSLKVMTEAAERIKKLEERVAALEIEQTKKNHERVH